MKKPYLTWEIRHRGRDHLILRHIAFSHSAVWFQTVPVLFAVFRKEPFADIIVYIRGTVRHFNRPIKIPNLISNIGSIQRNPPLHLHERWKHCLIGMGLWNLNRKSELRKLSDDVWKHLKFRASILHGLLVKVLGHPNFLIHHVNLYILHFQNPFWFFGLFLDQFLIWDALLRLPFHCWWFRP